MLDQIWHRVCFNVRICSVQRKKMPYVSYVKCRGPSKGPLVLSTSCCGVKIHDGYQSSLQGREELLQKGAIRETNTGVIYFQILPFPGANVHKFRIARV